MSADAATLRAILQAYWTAKQASWPSMHPAMAGRVGVWATADEAELRRELDGYLKESSAKGAVRVFYKLGPNFVIEGFNDHFARDTGLPAAELKGLDDFSEKLPWRAQAAKYRADDKDVFDSGQPKLDILERQTGSSGSITWVRVGKAPIRSPQGVIGILGMYELLDDKTAQKLYLERSRGK